jgi:hypothetical protein
MRTLVAILATLGLVAAISAIPASAQSCAAAASTATELSTDDVALASNGSFICTDAADSGEWSITVDVTNQSGSEVTITGLALSHVTPALQADAAGAAAATADASGLPLTLAAGATGSFGVSGEYTLAQVGGAGLLNVHLRASGTTAGEEAAPFTLAINVHLLAPGVELDEAGAEADAQLIAEGRPEWAPGPPPWAQVMLGARFIDGFPWGTDDFPPVIGAAASAGTSGNAAGAAAAAGGAAAGGATVDVGPPAQVELPAQAAAAAAVGADAEAAGDEITVEIDAGASGQVIVPPIGGRP